MILEFNITDQILKRIDSNIPVANSIGFLRAKFNLPSEYTGTITATVKKYENGSAVAVDYTVDKETGLTNYLDDIVQSNSNSSTTLYFSLSSTDTDIYIPTNQEIVQLKPSGQGLTQLPQPGQSTNQYEEIAQKHAEVMATAETIAQSVDGIIEAEASAKASEDNAKASEDNARTIADNMQTNIDSLSDDLSKTSSDLSNLKTSLSSYQLVTASNTSGFYGVSSNVASLQTNVYYNSIVLNVAKDEKYKFNTRVAIVQVYGFLMTDDSFNVIKSGLLGTGTLVDHTDHEEVIPDGVTKLIINYRNTMMPTIYKVKNLIDIKIDKPVSGNGTQNQVLVTNGDGTTNWSDALNAKYVSGFSDITNNYTNVANYYVNVNVDSHGIAYYTIPSATGAAYKKIPVNEGEKYLISTYCGYGCFMTVFSDASDVFNGYYNPPEFSTSSLKYFVDALVTIPTGAKYMYVNNRNTSFKTINVGKANIFVKNTSDLSISKSSNYLYGKTIIYKGDSMMYGNNTPHPATWKSLLCARNNMTYNLLAQNGAWITTGDPVSGRSVCSQATQITAEADYLLIHAGTNDRAQSVTIGNMDSTNTLELCGALNYIFTYLQTNFPKMKIGFITPYVYVTTNTGMDDYVTAIANMCAKYSIPVYLQKNSGINAVNNSPMHNMYFLSGYDVHLNALGHERVSYLYEQFLRSL